MKLLLALSMTLLLGACQSLGLSSPQSLDEQLASAYGLHTAVLSTTTQSLQAGTISKADAQAVLKLSDEAQGILDASHAIATSDPAGAQTKLTLALSVLTEVQTYLRTHGK